jgi:hypothetical protein
MVRKIRRLFSSSGDQQEQPFVQVNADHSIWISKQRLATSSTGWRLMLMTFKARIRQIDWLVSGCNVQCQAPGRHRPGAAAAHPDVSQWYARYPLGRGRASFDLEQLTQPCVLDWYHGIAHG